MDRLDKIVYATIAASVAIVCTLLFATAQLRAERYYKCVYTFKTVGVTPTDLQAICLR